MSRQQQALSFREMRAIERRREILETAARLFREKGYQAVTIEEIANYLKLTKASLYYYVDSKEDLFLECLYAAMDPLLEEASQIAESNLDPVEKLERLITNHVLRLVNEIYIAPVILQHLESLPPRIKDIAVAGRNEYDKIFRTVLLEGMEKGCFRQQNPTITTYLILGSLNWIPHWFSSKGPLNKEDVAKFFVDNLLRVVKVG